jgi:predicted ATP-grasp superfamily ATP-dependent carboligase
VRVFISEYVCSGACGELDVASSLACEGRAMLLALLADAARVPAWTVCTTWDRRLGNFPLPNVGVVVVDHPVHEQEVFHRLATKCDATYVIAPELDDLLGRRCQGVLDSGGRSLNAHPEAIRLCSDKLALARHLQECEIPTIPTALLVRGTAPTCGFPAVLKPRFGAGSQDTYLLRGRRGFDEYAACFEDAPETHQGIVQPLVPGRPISVAAIFDGLGRPAEVWPVADQWLSTDGRFHYLGGKAPADIPCHAAVETLVRAAGASVSGLCGYIGFDLLLPDLNPHEPLLVEINPRLTTSYGGYRTLTECNLTARVIGVEFGSETAARRLRRGLREPLEWSAKAEWRTKSMPSTAESISPTRRN